MTDYILDNLNSEQRKAVLQKDGPILIIAGAGSGKTRVLTSKIAMLLRDGVAPESILALTFTKKAAGEMKDRVRYMVNERSRALLIGTFHSVFIKFLRLYHDSVGFPENFTIYDEYDAESCLKDCIGEVLWGPGWNEKEVVKQLSDEQKKHRKKMFNIYKPQTVHSIISLAKNELVLPRQYRQDEARLGMDRKFGRERICDIYEHYMRKCHNAGAMDFDDILVYTAWLLNRDKEACKELSQRFQYILVDEFQDTNYVQYKIVETLAEAHRNICVVGDDSQSIYAFRGAKIQNIFNFKDRYPELKTFRLETNYRSTGKIVDAANKLIANNDNRLPKTCVSSRGEGEDILFLGFPDDREEARFVTDYIQDAVRSGNARYNEFAVLYRTNAQARILEDTMLRSRVPYIVWSGTSFFDRAEIKDAIAYMRLVINPCDDEAFKRICNRPSRGISDATLSTVSAIAARLRVPLYKVAKSATEEETGLKARACEALRQFACTLDEMNKQTSTLDAFEAVELILETTGLLEYYSAEEGEDGLKKSNNLKELRDSVMYFMNDQKEEYEKDLPDGPLEVSLRDYLENIALLSNADTDTRKHEAENVSLMTSHCSKGLEFRTAFVVGVEESLFPLIREDSTRFDEEEERRLFYVSITRAMDRLILTHAESRFRYGSCTSNVPSRFIGEMGISEMGISEESEAPEQSLGDHFENAEELF